MTRYAKWLKSLWNTEDSSTLMIQRHHPHKQVQWWSLHSQGISISQGRRKTPPRSSTKNSTGKRVEKVKWSSTDFHICPVMLPQTEGLRDSITEDSKSSSVPCFELNKIQKIGNSPVIFPVTHSTGIQTIMTTGSNKHSMLQKLNRKHSGFSHAYDSFGFTSLGPRFRP